MRAILFFLTFSVFVLTIVWRVDHIMFGDKLAWAEAQARVQISALAHALGVEVENLRNLLLLSYSEVELNKKDFSANKPYGRFAMMTKLLPPNAKDERRDWQVISQFFQDGSQVKSWAPSYVTLALKTIRETDVRPGSANVYSLMDPKRNPYLLVLVRETGNWYAGLLKTEVFQGLMDKQKGQKSTVFIVNLQGQALGHTTQEYVGSLLTEDPLVSELTKSSVGSGFGVFKNLKGEPVQGLYEQVENTNLYTVITTPVNGLVASRNSVRFQLLLMGIGLGLIGLAAFVLYDRKNPIRQPAPALPPALANSMVTTAPLPGIVNSSNAFVGTEKMKAYHVVASSLSHELKAPLTAILGHAQAVQTQLSNPSQGAGSENPRRQAEHLENIVREARSAHDLIQKLLIFTGEDKVQNQKAGLEVAVNKALKQVEGKILSKGIKLTADIQPGPSFVFPVELVVKAIENLLLNSIEAMERAPKKELMVSLVSNGPQQIQLSIKDTGEGIAKTDLPKIFDPFFTTRGHANHVGLGLSTAIGIFKEAFGEVQVESEKGKGTTVQVEFKPQGPVSAPVAEAQKKPALSQSALPKAPKAPVQTAMGEISVPVAPLPAPPAPPVPQTPLMDPLLVDNTIERLIEDDLPDMPPPPKEVTSSISFRPTMAPQSPVTSRTGSAKSEPAPSSPPSMKPGFSAKIDKPKLDLNLKKRVSDLDDLHVNIRRPGERA